MTRCLRGALALLVLLGGGCGDSPVSGPPTNGVSDDNSMNTVPVPTWTTGGWEEAALGGTLRGRVTDDLACLWLDHGDPNKRRPIMWPPGYRVRRNNASDPFEVLNGAGQVIAREGEDVSLTGGGGHAGEGCDDIDEQYTRVAPVEVTPGLERVDSP